MTFVTYLTGFILHFLLNQPIAGITKTSIDQLYDFTLIPLVFGYYVWISSKAGYLFLELKKRGVKLDGEKQFDSFAEASVNNLINHKFWSVASAIAAFSLVVITVFSAATYQTIWGPRESNFILLYFWKAPILWGFSWYMAFIIFIKETATIICLRRLLRKNMTEAEKLLWNAIRRKQLDGRRFRRQYSIRGFVLDFYSPEIKLAIEIDGGYHSKEDQVFYDSERQKLIQSLGIKFLRIKNDDIFSDIDNVVRKIKENIISSP